MIYNLKFNASFSHNDIKHFEDYLNDFLTKNELGIVRKKSTKVYQNDKEIKTKDETNIVPTHSILEIDLVDKSALDDLLEILDEMGIPFASKLYNDEISIDVGTLSVIEVNFTSTDKNLEKKLDKFEDKLTWEDLDELCVVSNSFIFENQVRLFLYIADVDMSLPIIESSLAKENWIKDVEINVSRSGYGISHRYFSLLRKNYKEKNKTLWNFVKDIYQGASEEDISALLKVYPDLPSSLIDLLKIIDGTWSTRHDKGVVYLPMFTTVEAGTPINLLSAKQMILNKETAKKQIQYSINTGASFDRFINNYIENMNLLPLAFSEFDYGSCQLYIDFYPSEKGNYGQLIVYAEKFNSYCTTAKSFDEFLLDILNNNFYDMFKSIESNEKFSVTDDFDENENLEYATEGIFWEFGSTEYLDSKEFNKALKKYMKSMDEDITVAELKEIVFENREIIISYEAWIDDVSKLKENEALDLEEGEKLLEEDKEDGMWQVNIFAHIKSDSKKGFTLGEIMMKTHNQMSNKELGDHIFFEGFEYVGHECKIDGLLDNEEGLPVFEVICGS